VSYSSEVLADSPAAYWRLGEASGNFADSSGNSRTLTPALSGGDITYGATSLLTTDTANKAITVSGTSAGYADGAASYDPTTLTLEAWIKPSSISTQCIIDRDNESLRIFQFRIESNGALALIWWTTSAGPFFCTSAASLITSGTKYHVAATVDGTTARVYINGTQVQSTTQSGNMKAGSTLPYRVAAHQNAGPGQRFAGTIDEVAIYGTALSSTRIADHYTAATTVPVTPTTLDAPVTVGAAFSAKTVLSSTLGLAASVGLAFGSSAIATTTVDVPVSVGASFAAATVEAGTTTLAMPATIGASFTAATVESVTTTVAAPATVGLGFDAHATASTTVDAPVTVGLSFAATKIEPTTLALPVTVGAEFSASLGGGTTLSMPVHVELFFTATGGDTIGSPWTGDLSGRTVLPFVTSGHAAATPPLAVVPEGYTERPIMRASRVVPDLRTIPGVIIDPVTNQPRLTDADYFALPVTEAEVGVPHLIFHHHGKVIDATYFRGGFTKILSDRREEPFGDATLSFELPNVSSMDSYPDDDDHPLWFLINRANVQIELVKSDGTSTIVWTGHVVATDTGNSESSPNKRLDCVGSLFQASTDRMHPPTFLDPTDIGTLMSRVLNAVTSRRYPVISAVATGILSRQRGSWADSPLAFVQSLLSTAWTSGGNQWTIAKIEGSRRSYELRLKKTTPEWTVTNGAHGVSVDLTRDGSAIRNVIYGHGVGPDGNAWFNYKYPNLHADTAPAYPFASPSSVITVGTTDAMTTSGDGVSVWQRRARDLGYKLAIDGVFNTSDADVARYVQRRFGASVDGVVGPQTWNATFGVGSNSGDLSAVIRLPLAADRRTQRYLYNGDGSVAGENPEFDGNVLIYADDVDFGSGITRAEGILSAQQIVERESEPGLTGRITLTQDPRENSRLLIPPGDKITLIGYEGADRVLHITAVERDWQTGTVTLEVDEKSRDAMTVAQIRTRDKEARRDPARRPGNPNRRSRLDVDQVVPFDGESGAGVIPKLALYGGLWTVIRIPVSETGRVAKMHLEAGAPFAIAFFGAPITPAHLNSYVGNPLAKSNPFKGQAANLDRHWFIEGFGEQGQRCGFYDGSEQGGDPFTGIEEQGGFSYQSSRPPWVWVAMYAASSCFLEGNIYPDTVI